MIDHSFAGKRTIDHLMASKAFGTYFPQEAVIREKWHEAEMSIRKTLNSAEVFEISNVADYFWSTAKEKNWNISQDFPCLMPPFQNLWLEYTLPKNIPLNFKVAKRCGVLIQTHPLTTDAHAYASHHQTCTVFLDTVIGESNRVVDGPLLEIHYYIQHNGTPHFHPEGILLQTPGIRHDWANQHRSMLSELAIYTYPALLAVTLLNCKNTSVTENQPPTKLAKAHLHRHNRPLVTFRTLQIEPLTKILHEATEGTSDLKRALHICRGHFKDFREQGLFGRHKGLYWWGAQARGRASKGVALKDYKIGKVKCAP